MPVSRADLRPAFGAVFGVAAVAGMAYFLASNWSEVSDGWVWNPIALAAALLLAVAALAGWAVAWTFVVPVHGQRRLVAQSFVVSQLGKYVPGGVWQAAGQIGLSGRTGLPKRLLAWRFIGFSLVLAAGAAVVAAVGSFALPVDMPVRLLAVAPVALVALILPSSARRIVPALSGRRIAAASLWHEGSQGPALALCAASFALYALGFALLLRSAGTSVSIPAAMSAFSFAWIVGFVVVVLPAGLGAREAVLVAFLGQTAPPATVLAVALLYRVVSLAAETVGTIATTILTKRDPPSGSRHLE